MPLRAFSDGTCESGLAMTDTCACRELNRAGNMTTKGGRRSYEQLLQNRRLEGKRGRSGTSHLPSCEDAGWVWIRNPVDRN